MSSDGPTLADESYDAAKLRGGHGHSHGHTHSHGGGPAHTHPLTPGQEAHARGRRTGSGHDDHDDQDDGHAGRPAGGSGHDFDLPDLPAAVDVFDTTLRDGSQQEGLSLTVDD